MVGCRLVEQCGFDRVNTAAYSPRPDTPAAEYANQVALPTTQFAGHGNCMHASHAIAKSAAKLHLVGAELLSRKLLAYSR